MQRLLALVLIFAFGCGTILNGSTAMAILPPGSAIDGVPANGMMAMPISKKTPHEIVYPDGRRCLVTPSLSVGYLILDIVLGLLPVIVDAITGDWTVLDASMCPGVAVD